MAVQRVLPPAPVTSLREFQAVGGGTGLEAAHRLGSEAVVEHLVAAGLRGRGGAGFPTGRKWAAVCDFESDVLAPTVVVNAAEGEPGTFKDRTLLRRNPYAVLEGALIAAYTVGASQVIVAVKRSFESEARALRRVIDELRDAGAVDGIDVTVFQGPDEYLYGEETALLEAIDGRPPFPRVAPPYRHGVREVREDDSDEPALVEMAAREHATVAPPTLVNNAETLAHVAAILANGPDWFREVGTDASPGTIVCTVHGCTQRHGVGEFAMGTPLRDVIDELGGGARPGRSLVAAMSGVANALVVSDALDTPLSYEAMERIGSGLGSAGFIVFDDTTDFLAVAHAVSRFLAVESCGQCTPCKRDGLALMDLLADARDESSRELDRLAIDDRLRTVAEGARCALALQHQRVVASIMNVYGEQLGGGADSALEAAELELVGPITDIEDGRSRLDDSWLRKQPDWSYDPVDSGKLPVERLAATEASR